MGDRFDWMSIAPPQKEKTVPKQNVSDHLTLTLALRKNGVEIVDGARDSESNFDGPENPGRICD